MKLFLQRLGESFLKGIIELFKIILAAVVLLAIFSVLALLAVGIPMYLLQFVIGDWAVLWIIILLLLMILSDEWSSIKRWFIWQFVEPFKKEE